MAKRNNTKKTKGAAAPKNTNATRKRKTDAAVADSNIAAVQNDTDAAVKNAAVAAVKDVAVAAGSKNKSSRLKEWESEEKLVLIEGWKRDGLTDQQIAKNMGCAYSTLRKWRDESMAISAALKKGKEVSDYIVENALFKKACGHKETVKKPIKMKRELYDPETGKKFATEEYIEYVDEEVYVPPDTVADIFWLKNRKPDEWKDKVETIEDKENDNSGVIMIAPILERQVDG